MDRQIVSNADVIASIERSRQAQIAALRAAYYGTSESRESE